MPEQVYTKDDWRTMDVEQLLAHTHDTAKLAQRHYDDENMDALKATLAAMRDQVDVLHDRQEELAGRVAERLAEVAALPAEPLNLLDDADPVV